MLGPSTDAGSGVEVSQYNHVTVRLIVIVHAEFGRQRLSANRPDPTVKVGEMQMQLH